MKTLIAVASCHHRIEFCNYQRFTWANNVENCVFFFGDGNHGDLKSDEVVLSNIFDGYVGLPQKIQAIMKWACEHDYDNVCKADDDVYLRPERLVNIYGDYVGSYQKATLRFPAGYCFGFSYILSREAMEVIAEAPVPDGGAEDRWVANTLFERGIIGQDDSRFVLLNKSLSATLKMPRVGNNVIACAEFDKNEMLVPHNEWKQSLEKYNSVMNAIKL